MTTEQDMAREFAQLMSTCKGNIFFVTEEGDRLVADSMLSALVGLANLLRFAREINMHVECDYPEDCERILAFIRKHNLNEHL